MNTTEFVNTINKLRLNGGWYFWSDTVNGKEVQLKGYGTYLQIFRINGYTVPAGMEMKVKEFKEVLEKAVQ